MQQRWRDLKSVKLLQYISCFFGVSIPNLHNYHGLSLIYVLYALSISLFSLACQLYCLIATVKIASVELSWNIYTFSSTVTVLKIIVYFFNVISTLFFQRKRIVCLNAKLNDLEEELYRKFQSRFDYNDSTLLLQIVFTITLSVLLFLVKLAGGFHYLSQSLEVSLMFFANFQTLSMFAFGFQIHFYSSRLRNTLRFMQKNMMRNIKPTRYNRGVKCSEEIVYCMRKYNQICNLIDEVSLTYRWQMFCMILILSLDTIINCNAILKLLLNMKRRGTYSIQPLLFTMSCIADDMFLATIVASTSEYVIDEARRTLLVNYKILMKFPSYSTNLDDNSTKEALMMFSDHIRMRKIEFSTGFFSINYSMLYTMGGFIVTNLIVILQFY